MQPDGTYGADGFFRSGGFNPDGTFTLLFADQGAWTFFAFDGPVRHGRAKTLRDDRSGHG